MTAVGFALLVAGLLISYWTSKNKPPIAYREGTLIEGLAVVFMAIGIVLLTIGISIALWRVMP